MAPDNTLISALRLIIQEIGDDPERDGLKDTPLRVIRSWQELYSGYTQDPEKVLKTTFQDETYDEMVLLRDVEFYSHCEHHMLPFFGRAHVAYLPDGGRVAGLSKLARLVEVYSRRLQIQERLTCQVTAALDKYLTPKGSACVIEAKHFCMVCRGVQKQESVMVTSSLTGAFKANEATRTEFLKLIGR